MRLRTWQGDITTLTVDAIVNAANNTLLGGGGVDGAIHRAAGPGLLVECRALQGCDTGQAKMTAAYQLPCQHVIHTVGPVWRGGNDDEASLLASCYVRCLELAVEHRLATIAFPAISCGVYGYPLQEAVSVAVKAVRDNPNELLQEVVFVCFGESMYQLYRQVLERTPA